MSSCASRVAVVSGANKGIGLSTVKLLLQRGFDGDVVLTSRDESRGRIALESLLELNLRPRYHHLDVEDADSIEQLKDFLVNSYGGLDVLINNAAINHYKSSLPYTVQVESILATNFFGTVQMCRTLFPILRPGARVVHLSSRLGHISKIPDGNLRRRLSSDDLTEEQLVALAEEFITASHDDVAERMGWCRSPYAVSKVLVAALARVHQRTFDREYAGQDMIVNSVHPGHVDTDLSGHLGPMTPEQGADAPVHLALLPLRAENNPRGEFVWWDRVSVPWTADSHLPDNRDN